jgi:hypothetical protein
MKKFFWVIILLMFSKYAIADWFLIASTDNRTVYVEHSTAIQRGNIVTIWILIDHNNIQKEEGDSYLSSKGQWEINCKANVGG